jgi:hypothetical protein
VVQHGHLGDQVSPAIARRRTKVSEVASVDAHLRKVAQARARRRGHAFIAVDSGDVREVRGQLPGQHTCPAADVYRSATAGGQVAQNPAVEMVVVAPGVTCIDFGQRSLAGIGKSLISMPGSLPRWRAEVPSAARFRRAL